MELTVFTEADFNLVSKSLKVFTILKAGHKLLKSIRVEVDFRELEPCAE